MPFGSRTYSRPPGRGWVQLLAPSPELWTLVLRHRTQILYVADISLVVAQLDLRPGCLVLESGTGSASLTHSLARAVAPHGRVRSFEFHELRAKEAGAELARNGIPATLASVELRNIEADGFPDAELAGAADGVFLDLPGPWKVVASAARCLKPDGRFCSFSPCIEQVQRTCERLDACGMTDIVTYEVLLRNYEVAEETLLAPLDGDVDGGGEGGEGGAGGEGDAAATAAAAAAASAAAAAAAEGDGGDGDGDDEQQQEQPSKRPRVEGDGGEDEAAAAAGGGGSNAAAVADAGPPSQEQQQQGQDGAQQQQQEQQQQPKPPAGKRRGPPPGAGTRPIKMVVARPSMEARGHTGYLTFARKFL